MDVVTYVESDEQTYTFFCKCTMSCALVQWYWRCPCHVMTFVFYSAAEINIISITSLACHWHNQTHFYKYMKNFFEGYNRQWTPIYTWYLWDSSTNIYVNPFTTRVPILFGSTHRLAISQSFLSEFPVHGAQSHIFI